ncbi:MAG: sorbosone dehydrogenase family protein [Armatimonadaceae bacterium]
MRRSTLVAASLLGVGGAALWGTVAVRAVERIQNPPEVVAVNAHVVKPEQVPSTEEMVRQLKLPAGFRITKFAESLENPRMLAVADDGTVYVTQRKPGNLVQLRDTNGDGKADSKNIVAQQPGMHGIAIRGNSMWLATVKEVFTAERNADGSVGSLKRIVDNLPDGGQHPNRTLAFGPDGYLFVSVGSTCNACTETNPESATILRMRPDGSERKIYASGLRNTIGFGWHPTSRRMYGMDHGIDWLGDTEQKEELNEIKNDVRYGWPFVYADGKFNPADSPEELGYTYEQWAKMSHEPVQLYTAHSAPMQMVFYTGTQFPAEYRNNAFVAMRGSWNRKPPSGYEVVRIRFDEQGNAQSIEPFITGFLQEQEGDNWRHFGRLAGMAMAKDGSLLLTDDTNGVMYRIAYTGNQ